MKLKYLKITSAKYVQKKLLGADCKKPDDVIPLEVCDRLHVESEGLPGVIDRLAVAAFSRAGKPALSVDDIPRKGSTDQSSTNVPVLSEPVHLKDEAELDSSLPHLIVTLNGETINRVEVNKQRFMIQFHTLFSRQSQGLVKSLL